jgi:hypothetical protein
MGNLETNLVLDLEDPDEALKSAFASHDFSCAAALLNAGVRLPEEGFELQQLVIGLENDTSLEPLAADIIAKSIFKTFQKNDICELPFARNAINSLCRQGLNADMGDITGFTCMAKALLQAASCTQGADHDLVNTIMEAFYDDFLDMPDERHLDMYFTRLGEFDPQGLSLAPFAAFIADKHFTPFAIWGETPDDNLPENPTKELIGSILLTLVGKIDSGEKFKWALAEALNPDMAPGSIALDLITFSEGGLGRMERESFHQAAGDIFRRNLSLDELSKIVEDDVHLKLIGKLGIETDSLNKSLLRPSVLASVFETDLGL